MEIDKRFRKSIGNYEQHCIHIAKSTAVQFGESAAEKVARIQRLESNYIEWFEYYFPTYAKAKCAWFHKDFADRIIYNNEIYEQLEIYRSGAKSVHIDMGIPLFLMFTKRMRFMLLIGQTQPKANKLLSACQAQLVYNQRLIADYGEKYKHGDWAEGEFLTSDGIRFMALGFGQDPRGVREGADRPDYIVVDDVDNRRHVNNDRMMREAVEWIFEDLIGKSH